MRFVLAIVSFLLAAVLIGAGLAQRTIFAAPDRVIENISVDSTAPVTIIDGTTLNAFPRSQTVKIDGSATVFAAYGRTTDVMAWVGTASYNTVSFDPETAELTSETIAGTEETVPSPAGSDLWLSENSAESALAFTVNVPDDISVIIVSDGQTPAPANISLSWPLDNSTPWSGPLVAAGGVLLLLGLAFLIWAVAHLRRARGPRRNQPKMPKMPKLPKPPRYKPTKQKALPVGASRGRRSIRSSIAALPVVLVVSLALGACSATPAPSVPVPTPTESSDATNALPAVAEEEQPAVTVLQARRIIADAAAVAASADESNSVKTLETRFSGPALERRTAAYKIHKADSKSDPLLAIPAGPVSLTLPSKSDGWPRTVFAVVQDETDTEVPTVAYMLIQDDARSQYKVHYVTTLEPGLELPPLANASVGAVRVADDSKFFTLEPSLLAEAYGSILMKDEKSPYYELFEAEGDTLRADVGVAAKKERQKKLPDTASLKFSVEPGDGQAVVLSTNDSGALVAVELMETETVKPIQTGAAVNAPKDVKALLGKSLSTKGITATYADQLLFYVPSATVGGKIILLGYSQGLVSASELKKK